MEEFLNIKDANSRKAISRIRSSAHDLNIELGRYQKKCGATPFLAEKACRLCCDRNAINDLQLLPGFNPIIEDECHAISTCPLYHQL